jgi:MFS family permease
MDHQNRVFATDAPGTPVPPAPAGKPVSRRAVALTSSVGNLIEIYDFTIYGVAAAMVFPAVFFPSLSATAATIASFATFGVAFIARPLGGVVFGHLGDRLGRKKTLVATLLLMGIATTLIGVLPPTGAIGVAAPMILIALRVLQGLAAGGEWAGANLFAAEHAPEGERGRWTMFPQLGAAAAFGLANATFLAVSLGLDDEAFRSWGWRIPFIASAVLVAVGLYIRLAIEETPVFRRAVAGDRAARLPFFEAIRRQPRQILVGTGVGMTMSALYYISGTYLTSFATTTLALTRTDILVAGIVGGAFVVVGALTSGLLADRVGRRRLIAGANGAAAVWALLLFPVLNNATVLAFALALCVTLFIVGFISSPLGAFLPEQFQTRHRYTASAVSYNLGALLGGSVAPLLAPVLVASLGTFAFGLFLAVLGGVGTICTVSLRDARKVSLDDV